MSLWDRQGANVIQNAYSSDEYEVRVRLAGSCCVAEVVDTGRGGGAAANEPYLGLPLVRVRGTPPPRARP
jgi:hypothetical protein